MWCVSVMVTWFTPLGPSHSRTSSHIKASVLISFSVMISKLIILCTFLSFAPEPWIHQVTFYNLGAFTCEEKHKVICTHHHHHHYWPCISELSFRKKGVDEQDNIEPSHLMEHGCQVASDVKGKLMEKMHPYQISLFYYQWDHLPNPFS